MENLALIIDPKEFGVEENQAKELMANLPQLKEERSILEQQYSLIIKMDIEDPSTSKKAQELRKLIKNNRTKGIEVWHKNAKDYFLKGGQFVDAIKRKEIAINEKMEDDLEQIEKYAELKEQKRLDELEAIRIETLQPYSEFVPFGANLRIISDEDFNKILNGAKLQYEAKIQSEKKAEEERLENERLENVERERRIKISPFNQFVTQQADLRNISDDEFDTYFALLQKAKSNYEAEQEKIRKENERLKKDAEAKEKALELEREKARKEAAELEAKRQKEIQAEREKQAKLEAALKAKRDAEIEAENKRVAEELEVKKKAEQLAKAPVKEQLSHWVNTFNIAEKPNNQQLAIEIEAKFNSFKNWALNQIKAL
jgi:hypothetical protein